MKKIIAILTAFAAALSLASCSMKNDKTTADYLTEQAIEESQLIESLTQAAIEHSQKVNKAVDKLGKTEKGKRLVIEVPYAHGKEYRVFEMDKNQECKYTINYFFYDDEEVFMINKENDDKYDVDKDLKMVAYKNDYESFSHKTYDDLYELYSSDSAIQDGYVIIK